MPRPLLELRRVSFRRDGVAILDRVDWTIRSGEHWALLGANGAGKTTLLRIVAGYQWPSEGEVHVLGEAFGATDLREIRKSIGWVTSSLTEKFPETDDALRIVLSGFEASVGLWRDFNSEELKQANAALREVGMDGLARRSYSVLSQGERQRVMLARALVHRPKLLILDEPCAGLDPAARQDFLSDLERFARRRRAPTLIFVTHHLEEIPPFVSNALLLRSGKVLASGPMSAVCTSALLGKTFGRPCEVEFEDGRYSMKLRRDSRRRAG